MIYEILAEGRENAMTAREISVYFGCDVRAVTSQIERERREGRPICAATGDNPGYFLPANDDDLRTYCDQLQGRVLEILKTRRALIRTLETKNGGADDE